MTKNPYETSEVALESYSAPEESRSLLLLLTTLVLIALALFSFYSVLLITERSANYIESIEQLEELTNRIETRELTLKRESLIRYFEASRESAEQELKIQNSAFLGFIFIGLVLVLVSVLQLVTFKNTRKYVQTSNRYRGVS